MRRASPPRIVIPSEAKESLLLPYPHQHRQTVYMKHRTPIHRDTVFPIFRFPRTIHLTVNEKDSSTSVGMTIREGHSRRFYIMMRCTTPIEPLEPVDPFEPMQKAVPTM